MTSTINTHLHNSNLHKTRNEFELIRLCSHETELNYTSLAFCISILCYGYRWEEKHYHLIYLKQFRHYRDSSIRKIKSDKN